MAARRYPLADGSGRVMPITRGLVDSQGEPGVTERAYDFRRHPQRRARGNFLPDTKVRRRISRTFPGALTARSAGLGLDGAWGRGPPKNNDPGGSASKRQSESQPEAGRFKPCDGTSPGCAETPGSLAEAEAR